MTAFASTSKVRFEIGRVFTRTFGVIGANLVPFLALAILFQAVPAALVSLGTFYAKAHTGADLSLVRDAVMLVRVALGYVLTAAIVRGAIVDLDGRKASLGDCLSMGLRYAAPALVVALITMLGYFVGLILLIVPGVILMLAWSVATPVLVIERKGVFGSLSRSAELTRGHRWSMLGLYVCMGLLMIVLSLPCGLVTGIVSAMTPGNLVPALIFSSLVSAVEAMFIAVALTAAYTELRGSREGVGVAELASVFD
jgi:hypothetical protein